MHHACFGEGVGCVKGAGTSPPSPALLTSPTGSQHKRQRKRLGPALTVASVKRMAPAFYGIAHELLSVFENFLSPGPSGNDSIEVDVLSWLSRAALEMIAQGGMGYTFNTLKSALAKEDESAKEHPYPKAAGDLS